MSYAAGQQAGADYGLPTSVTGASFTQIDGTAIAPTQTFWYDATGHVRCYNGGQGTSVIAYDALGRMTSIADADDSSANALSLCGKSTGQPGWNTQTTYSYFPSGGIASSQTPAERAGGVATTFTYDADGNTTTETRHYACAPGGSCTPGVTTRWYDGADRLVEVGLPHDPSDYYASPWLTRYFYDLSAGGLISLAGASFRAYGNLFKTQEWVPPSAGAAPTWVDLRGTAFDAVDRPVTKYTFSPSSNTTLRATTMTYDAGTATLGLPASTTDPLGETTAFTYDAAGHPTTVQFSGDGGVTPNKSFVYDAKGRLTSATGAVYGTETTRYDDDGRLAEVDEPTSGAITSPARITYDYYPDGTRKDVNVASSALNAAPLMSYAYRADGKRRVVHVGFGQQQGNFATTFTDAGRAVSRSDPFTGTAIPSPRSPVTPGTAYGPTTWAYDGAGRLTTAQLPQTFEYQAIGHDDESVVTSWTGSSSGNGSATMTLTNTIRGENIYQSLGTVASASYSARIANGTVVRSQPHSLRPPTTGLTTSVDPTNAVVASTSKDVYVASSDPDMPGYVNCGNATTTNDYDAASRFVSKTQTMPNVSTAPGLEGFDYAGLTFQGARAVDSATGQWTTPDAYAGDVHDPMSQKAFMWDRNDPYEYSDPSGFMPQQVAECPGCFGHGFESREAAQDRADSQRAENSDSGGKGDSERDAWDEAKAQRDPMSNQRAQEIMGLPSVHTRPDGSQDVARAVLETRLRTLALMPWEVRAMAEKGLTRRKLQELIADYQRAIATKKRWDLFAPRLQFFQHVLGMYPNGMDMRGMPP